MAKKNLENDTSLSNVHPLVRQLADSIKEQWPEVNKMREELRSRYADTKDHPELIGLDIESLIRNCVRWRNLEIGHLPELEQLVPFSRLSAKSVDALLRREQREIANECPEWWIRAFVKSTPLPCYVVKVKQSEMAKWRRDYPLGKTDDWRRVELAKVHGQEAIVCAASDSFLRAHEYDKHDHLSLTQVINDRLVWVENTDPDGQEHRDYAEFFWFKGAFEGIFNRNPECEFPVMFGHPVSTEFALLKRFGMLPQGEGFGDPEYAYVIMYYFFGRPLTPEQKNKLLKEFRAIKKKRDAKEPTFAKSPPNPS